MRRCLDVSGRLHALLTGNIEFLPFEGLRGCAYAAPRKSIVSKRGTEDAYVC